MSEKNMPAKKRFKIIEKVSNKLILFTFFISFFHKNVMVYNFFF